jgi:transposase
MYETQVLQDLVLNQIGIGNWLDLNSLLCQAEEEFSARGRFPAIEAKGELVEVVFEMLLSNGALVGSKHPALEQGDHVVNSGQQMEAPVLGALNVTPVQIILKCGEDRSDSEVAGLLRTSNSTVGLWRKRFLERGVEGLLDEPRAGAPRQMDDKRIEEVVTKTLETTPGGGSHWSRRLMARKLNLSQSSVSRIWRAFGLKPHRSETFVLSKDPQLVQKVRDIVALYLSPPVNALVLCVDEKSRIQALSRSQPILPMQPGQIQRRIPDYFRHGTTNLFAALDIATGRVIGRCFAKHRSLEFRKFLDLIESCVSPDLDIHIVLDNYATHKTDIIKRWLARRPRYHLHFTPTHASWLNQIERWFGLLTQRQIKRGSHSSVGSLIYAIETFIASHNQQPKPFNWQRSSEEILAAISRFASKTLQAHS